MVRTPERSRRRRGRCAPPPESPTLAPAAARFRAGRFPGNLSAFFARFAEADGDRLLSALHPAARSAFERSPFLAPHRRRHPLACCLAVLGHDSPRLTHEERHARRLPPLD